MADTQAKADLCSPMKLRQSTQLSTKSSPSIHLIPSTPRIQATSYRSSRKVSNLENSVRRSSRRKSLDFSLTTPKKCNSDGINSAKTPNPARTCKTLDASFSPVSPDQSEARKRRRTSTAKDSTKRFALGDAYSSKKRKKISESKPVYYKKIRYDGGVFEVGDDVYVKKREYASSDDEDPEVEECRLCFKAGISVMIECDDCLGGFHLRCLRPPLAEVPEGDWICGFCEARKMGKEFVPSVSPEGKKRTRTAREKLLSGHLWAAHIESIWKYVDGTYKCNVRWYIIPEETSAGRQQHNLRRELYLTKDFSDIEVESIIRHCYVMNPKDFSKANNDGDDIFLCEYEYDVHWHSFKRLSDIDDDEKEIKGLESDGEWKPYENSESEEEETDNDDEDITLDDDMKISRRSSIHVSAANSRKGQFFDLQKIGVKRIPEHARSHKQTDLERAKATLLLSTLPKFLPCRNREMEEITSFIKGAICSDHCLGRCLYIHGVPGTGKTMSVLSVTRNLRSEVDAGNLKPYCFLEINGLKLSSPENIYRVIYEGLTGYRVGWKKALHLLNERFSFENERKNANRPCILLIDELDLLVTRNQSVLYNILDWPTRPQSKLIVIGIANTMDLPEKLLPRISSRMGIQRLCFGPYNHKQLEEIISSRLTGIDVFEKQAIEFASRKVAAVSGDARRALEICRRAAELADYQIKKSSSNLTGEGRIGIKEIDAAIKEMFQAPHVQVMRSCSKFAKIFLTAMVHELYKTGMGETTFEKLAFMISCLCTSNGEAFPGWDALMTVGCKLGECRIIICEPASKHKLQKLRLNFPSDDVAFALKDGKDLPWLAKYL